MSKRSELIGKVRAMMTPQVINLIRVEGITRRNGLAISDRELKALQEKHTVRIIAIKPASEFFQSVE